MIGLINKLTDQIATQNKIRWESQIENAGKEKSGQRSHQLDTEWVGDTNGIEVKAT